MLQTFGNFFKKSDKPPNYDTITQYEPYEPPSYKEPKCNEEKLDFSYFRYQYPPIGKQIPGSITLWDLKIENGRTVLRNHNYYDENSNYKQIERLLKNLMKVQGLAYHSNDEARNRGYRGKHYIDMSFNQIEFLIANMPKHIKGRFAVTFEFAIINKNETWSEVVANIIGLSAIL